MIEPVEIEFLLKNVNSAQVTEQMKKDVAGVGATTQRMTERVSASLNNQAANYNRASSGAAQFSKVNNQLSFSIQQVARELPNAAISSQIFFMAISNNLPILADNLKRAREEYARAKAAGEQSIPVWKQVTGSILSWQTLLVAGITVLTVWGADIVKGISNLFKFRNEVGLTKDEVKSLNDSFTKNAGNDLGKLKTMFDQLDNAKRGTAEWYAAKKDIIDQFGPYLRGMDAEIASLNNQSKAYEALSKSILKAAKDKALIETNSKLATDFLTKSNESYDIIEENFIKKFGANLGKLRFGMLKNQLESGQGLTYEMQRYVDEFNRKSQRVVGVSTTGSPQFSGEYVVNNVADAINAYTKAKNEFDQKTKDAFNRLGSSTTTTEVKNTVQVIEERIQQLKNEQKQVSENRAQWDAYQKQIKELELKKEAITGKEDKKNLTTDKEKSERSMIEISKEYLDLQNQIIAKEKELTQAILDGNTDLSLKLGQELEALQKKKNNMVNGGTTIKGNKGSLTPISMAQTELKPMKQLTDEQRKQLEAKGRQLFMDGKSLENEQQRQELLMGISQLIDETVNKYAEMLGLSEDQQDILKTSANALKGMAQIASGNVIQGSLTVLASAAEGLIQAPEKLSEHFENVNKQIEKVIQSLNIANESLTNLGGNSSFTSLQIVKSQLFDVAEEAQKLNAELAKSSTGRRRDTNETLPASNMVKQAADLNAEIVKLSTRLLSGDISDEQRKSIEALLNSYNSLISEIDSVIRDLTGTTVNDLGKSLAEAFLTGEDAAAAWGDKVDSIIKNVIVRQLTAKLLTNPITEAVNTLVNDSSDGLSTEEAVKFKDTMDKLYAATGPAFDAVIKQLESAGINVGNQSKSSVLTGISASATEDTVSALVGQIMAMRIDIKDAVKMAAQGQDDRGLFLKYTKQIAENTSHNIRLIKIDEGIAEMNKTLKERL